MRGKSLFVIFFIIFLFIQGSCGKDENGVKSDKTPPLEISNLQAYIKSDSVKFIWKNPVNSDFAGVVIVKNTFSFPSSITDGSILFNSVATEVTDNDVIDGRKYFYRFITYDNNNNYSVGVTYAVLITNSALYGKELIQTELLSVITKYKNEILFTWVNDTDFYYKLEITSEALSVSEELQSNNSFLLTGFGNGEKIYYSLLTCYKDYSKCIGSEKQMIYVPEIISGDNGIFNTSLLSSIPFSVDETDFFYPHFFKFSFGLAETDGVIFATKNSIVYSNNREVKTIDAGIYPFLLALKDFSDNSFYILYSDLSNDKSLKLSKVNNGKSSIFVIGKDAPISCGDIVNKTNIVFSVKNRLYLYNENDTFPIYTTDTSNVISHCRTVIINDKLFIAIVTAKNYSGTNDYKSKLQLLEFSNNTISKKQTLTDDFDGLFLFPYYSINMDILNFDGLMPMVIISYIDRTYHGYFDYYYFNNGSSVKNSLSDQISETGYYNISFEIKNNNGKGVGVITDTKSTLDMSDEYTKYITFSVNDNIIQNIYSETVNSNNYNFSSISYYKNTKQFLFETYISPVFFSEFMKNNLSSWSNIYNSVDKKFEIVKGDNLRYVVDTDNQNIYSITGTDVVVEATTASDGKYFTVANVDFHSHLLDFKDLTGTNYQVEDSFNGDVLWRGAGSGKDYLTTMKFYEYPVVSFFSGDSIVVSSNTGGSWQSDEIVADNSLFVDGVPLEFSNLVTDVNSGNMYLIYFTNNGRLSVAKYVNKQFYGNIYLSFLHSSIQEISFLDSFLLKKKIFIAVSVFEDNKKNIYLITFNTEDSSSQLQLLDFEGLYPILYGAADNSKPDLLYYDYENKNFVIYNLENNKKVFVGYIDVLGDTEPTSKFKPKNIRRCNINGINKICIDLIDFTGRPLTIIP